MANSLFTGVSGLVAHQKMLQVVGHNLANLNTTGFKARRVLFSDELYQTHAADSSPARDTGGGTNPLQTGQGVNVAQVDILLEQGSLELTGRELDFAIDGNGFFVLNNGRQNVYSRDGAFALDKSGLLVDPSTGYRVQRFGNVGEIGGAAIGFQVPGNEDIRIPLGDSIPGQVSSAVSIAGNLDAAFVGPLATELTSANALTQSGAPATTTTLLNQLDTNQTPYGAGDAIDITGVDALGNTVSTSLAVTATTQVGDLISAISSNFAGTTASLDASGNIVLTADATGPGELQLELNDAATNVGQTNLALHAAVETTAGKDGDKFQTATEIYDVQGGAHTVHLTFEKTANNEWAFSPTMATPTGTILSNTVEELRFNDDGTLNQVITTNGAPATLSFQANGLATPQTVELDFGSTGGFDGLNQLATAASLSSQQDGFPPGSLLGINVTTDGQIEGVATNGQKVVIAQLAVASFQNPGGLSSSGDNNFQTSLNSGTPQIGTAASGRRGNISGAQLEASNVEIAQEFTKLIVAQRGFSANARTVTVSDEVLEELTSLIR